MREISGKELDEWMAYYTLEPFGQEAGYVQAATICSTIMGSQGKRIPVKDFLPEWMQRDIMEYKQPVEEMKEIFKAIAG